MNNQPLSVVLIPGFMLDETLWDKLRPLLPAHWTLYTPDLQQGNTIPEIARHIAESISGPFVLIGFSLGGYIARALAAQYPDKISALILIATSLRPDTARQQAQKQAAMRMNSRDQYKGISTLAISKTLHPDSARDTTLIHHIQTMSLHLGYDAFVSQSLLVRDQYPLDHLTCPTLVIGGNQDLLRSKEEVTELQQSIPHAELVWIDHTGHMIPLEQPHILANTLTTWINQSV